MIIQIRCKTDRITVIVRRWHGYKKDVRIPNGVQERDNKGFSVLRGDIYGQEINPYNQ